MTPPDTPTSDELRMADPHRYGVLKPRPASPEIRAFAHRVFAGVDIVRIADALNVAPETLLNIVEKNERSRAPWFADTLTVTDVGEALDAKFRLDGLDK